jgi:hypothetical protein
LEAFARSPIVQGSAWPGVGPFKAGADDNTLVDAQNDTLKVEANEQKQVTGVDLQLTGRSAHDFLTVEMSSDFLLEALGTKPARIADFNAALEKSRNAVFTKRAVATISAARYKVRLLPNVDDQNQLLVHIENTEAVS